MNTEKKLKVIIAFLLVVIVYFSMQIVRLENYHYAVQVGFCSDVSQFDRDKCLSGKETRTNPIYHLMYGLKLLN